MVSLFFKATYAVDRGKYGWKAAKWSLFFSERRMLKKRIARKQKTGLNKTLAPIIRNYQNITTQRRRADPVRIKRITRLIEDNRIPSSKPYKQLLKQFSEMEKSHNADSKANPEPDFGWFVHELDNLLERDRIYAAAKIIRSVEAIRRENIQLVAYLVIN